MKTALLKGLRYIYRKISHKEYRGWDWPSPEDWEKTNNLIYEILESDKPCWIGRIGTTEGAIVHNRLTLTPPNSFARLKGCFRYIISDTRLPWWDADRPVNELITYSGFFSRNGVTLKLVEKFADLYLHYIPLMDVCGRFAAYEHYLPFSPDCKMVQLESLYPFFAKKPWMLALKEKKVLVVHPFKNTIEAQYQKRKLLFSNPDILPDFDLTVIKAVQSIAGEIPPYEDWFDALDAMKKQIASVDFDVAILGCGAYGLPLAGYIKEELHKKAIHLGGGTQLLFGIKGRRWQVDYKNSCYRDLFNEYWVSPDESERPQNFNKIEGGCYW